MRRSLLCLPLLLLLAWSAAGSPGGPYPRAGGFSPGDEGGTLAAPWAAQTAPVFTENKGQLRGTDGSLRPEVKYSADLGAAKLFFQNGKVSYVYARVSGALQPAGQSSTGNAPRSITGLYRMDLEFVGANPNATLDVSEQATDLGVDNYYLPGRPAITNVRHFRGLTYKNVWPNIDVVFHTTGTNGQVKYDFVVRPGGNPADIKMRYAGADQVNLGRDGQISVTNPYGSIREQLPLAYQGNEDNRVDARFAMNNGEIVVKVGDYNKTQTLVIDPLVIVWSTFFGGELVDALQDITTDASGRVYVTGTTLSIQTFPVAVGETIDNLNSSPTPTQDVITARYASTGQRQWRTILGGDGADLGRGIATIPNGSLVAVTGVSQSPIVGQAVPRGFPTNFPITFPASQQVYGGGAADAFVLMMDGTDGSLNWSTFYGGETGGNPSIVTTIGSDQGNAILFDPTGSFVYVSGSTYSNDLTVGNGGLTVLAGAYNQTDAIDSDGFILRYATNDGTRSWATYYGGNDADGINGMDIAADGGIVVTGSTADGAAAAYSGSLNPCNACGPNAPDLYVTRFTAGGARAWTTFAGGLGQAVGYDVAVAANGNIGVAGSTFSSTIPSFSGSTAGGEDAIALILNGNGGFVWGRFLGGNNNDQASGVDFDLDGDIVITGGTFSSAATFPLTFPVDNTQGIGGREAFLTKFDGASAGIEYSTFFGGASDDVSFQTHVDFNDDVYIVGRTQSDFNPGNPSDPNNFPISALAGNFIQQQQRGGDIFEDGFIAKIRCVPVTPTIVGLASQFCTTNPCVNLVGSPAGGTFTINGAVATQFCPGTLGAGAHLVTYTYTDACGTTQTNQIVNVFAPPSVVSIVPQDGAAGPYCTAGAASAPDVLIGTPAGGVWSIVPSVAGMLNTNPDGTATFTPTLGGTYTIFYQNAPGVACPFSTSLVVSVTQQPIATISTTIGALQPTYCFTQPCLTLVGTPATGGSVVGTFSVSPADPGVFTAPNQFCPQFAPAGGRTYTITYSGTDGPCTFSTTALVTVERPIAQITSAPASICLTSPCTTLTATPAGGTWSGPGIQNPTTSGLFCPAGAGVGTHIIFYTGTVNGCPYSTSTQIVVTTPPVASFTGLLPSYCVNSAASNLNGLLDGVDQNVGTFSGNGVNDGAANDGDATFDPAIAGPGTHAITYSGTFNGCTFTTTLTTTVNALPVVDFALPASVCSNAATFQLTGSPAGGTFSSIPAGYINGTIFNPAFGAGAVTVCYSYINPATGCSNAICRVINVVTPAVPAITGLNPQYCLSQPAVAVTGLLNGAGAGRGDFSGNGIANGTANDGLATFTPGNAGVGIHTITFSGLDANGCVFSTTTSVEVVADPVPAINGLADSYCQFDGAQLITGSPAGGTFAVTQGNPAVLTNVGGQTFFNPNTGVGTYVITYSGTTAIGCVYSTSQTVTVTAQPTASITPPAQPICETAPAFQLEASPSNPAGTFTSNPAGYVSATGVFNPGAANIDVPTTVSVTYAGGFGLCAYTTTINITLSPAPTPSITGSDSPYCVTEACDVLTGLPLGGTFSGTGVLADGTFCPATAGVGVHTITYSGNLAGCDYTTSIQVDVRAVPVVTISGSDSPYCVNEGCDDLDGSLAGGFFSGPGITDVVAGTFCPANAGVGTHTIFYTGNDGACNYTTSIVIEVQAVPVVTISGSDSPYCINEPADQFTANLPGTFSGAGITAGGLFNPALAGAGTHAISFIGNNGVCTYSTTILVEVFPLPNPVISGLPAGPICELSDDIQLTANPAGGTWSSVPAGYVDAVTGILSPDLVDLSDAVTVTIRYDVTVNGCSNFTTATITILPQPAATIDGSDEVYCTIGQPDILTGTPANGVWSIVPAIPGALTSLPDGTASFNPAAGAGDYQITYQGTDGVCPFTSTIDVTVIDPTAASISGLGSLYCENNAPVTLTGSPAGGGFFSQPINAIINGNQFDPSVGPGNYIVVYTGSTVGNDNTCPYVATATTQVIPAPQASICGLTDGDEFCTTNVGFQLCASPAGGTFSSSVPGLVTPGGFFNPGAATASGTYQITYSGSLLGCDYSAVVNVEINTPVTPSISGLTAPFCSNGSGSIVTAFPPGGEWVISGQCNGQGPRLLSEDGYFNFFPGTCSGNFLLTYYGTYNECTYSTSVLIFVSNPVVATVDLIGDRVCTGGEPIQLNGVPPGGTFASSCGGVTFDGTNYFFNPNTASLGACTITYTGSFNGCGYSVSQETEVVDNSGEVPQFQNLEDTYCNDDLPFTLTCTPAGGTFTASVPGALSGRTFNPSAVTPGSTVTITYTVGVGSCELTTSQTVTVLDCTCETPNIPIVLDATPSTLTVNWDNPNLNTRYEVCIGLSETGTSFFCDTVLSGNDFEEVLAYVFTGLDQQTSYDICVTALCADGVFPSETICNTGTTRLCAAIDDIEVTDVTETTALVSWTPTSVEFSSGFEVSYFPVDGDPNAALTVVAPTSPVTLDDLLCGTSYQVAVRAICGTQFSDPIEDVFTTNVCQACTLVTEAASANVTETTADVTWTEVNDALGYRIEAYQCNDPSQSILFVGNIPQSGTGTGTVTIDGLLCDSTYCVSVITICNDGSSLQPDAPQVTFTTAACVDECEAPASALASNITETGFTISWAEEVGALGYQVQYNEVGSTEIFTLPGIPASASPTADIPGTSGNPALTCATAYEVTIITVCADGSSVFPASAQLTVTTADCPVEEPITFQLRLGLGQFEEAFGIDQTTDGGYIVTGYTASAGAGSRDVLLAKFDAIGGLQWQQSYGGAEADFGNSVIETTDGGYLIAGQSNSFGTETTTLYLIKTDATGAIQWENNFRGTDNRRAQSVIEANGGYVVAGTALRQGSANNTDVLLLHVDANGSQVWEQVYGGDAEDIAYDVAADADGFIITGITSSFGAGNRDAYLIKTDANGELVWSRAYGGAAADFGRSVDATADGGYVIGGSTASFGSINDAYLVKTDATGNVEFAHVFTGGNFAVDFAYGVEQTADGGYALAGGFANADAYLVKTDAAGLLEWSRIYGAANTDAAFAFVQAADGGYALAGTTRPTGNPDIYVLKTDDEGNTNDCNVQVAPTTVTNVTASTIVTTTATQDIAPLGVVQPSVSNVVDPLLGFVYICEPTGEIEDCTGSIAASDDVAFCVGGFADLNVNLVNLSGTETITWNPGNGSGSTFTVSPATTTTYTVTVVDGACTYTDQVTVTVSEPVASVETVVFDGTAYDVTFELSGGVAPYDATLVATNGTATVTGTTQFAQFVDIAAGDWTLTVTDALGCSGTLTGTLDPTCTIAVDIVEGDQTVCAGTDANLTAAVSGAQGNVTYLWSNGETTSAIVVTETGVYTVDVTDEAGCTTSSASVTVTVNALPIVTIEPASATINEGQSITLTASGADTYEWNTTDATAAITVSPIVTTTYTVTGTANGCSSDATVTVTVLPVVADCEAPANVAVPANGITSSDAGVTWDAAEGAASYQLTLESACNTVTFAAGSNGFTLTSLLPGTDYTLTVATVCTTGEILPAAPVTFTTLVGCVAPVVTDITAAATTATVTWNNVPTAIQYTVSWRRNIVGSTWTTTTIPAGAGCTGTFTIPGLLSGTDYLYRMRSRCATALPFSPWTSDQPFSTLAGRGAAEEDVFTSNEAANFTVYPNPNKGTFNVSFTAPYEGLAHMSMMDATGRLAYEAEVELSEGDNTVPVTVNVAAGMYVLRFIQGENLFVVKIQVQ